MFGKSDSLSSVPAVCPNCKKDIKANPTDGVDFCRFCNKPFSVKDAIECFEKSTISKIPSDCAMKKFNALLANDYKLAEIYIQDMIIKEYPNEYIKYLSFSNYRYLDSIPYKFEVKISDSNHFLYCIDNVIKSFELVRSINRYIAEMYYKIFSAHVNHILHKENNLFKYKGGLSFLKIKLHSMEFKRNKDYGDYGAVAEYWVNHKNIFNKCNQYQYSGNDYDDEYVLNLIQEIHTVKRYDKYNDDKPSNRYYSEAIRNLETLLSTQYRKEEQKKRKERERLADIKKLKDAFDKEVVFWNRYIALIMAKKIKRAYELLKKESYNINYEPYKSEIAKFKKKVFGIKYLDDASLLRAETLAEKAIKHYS